MRRAAAAAILAALLLSAPAASAQRRGEYLTDGEQDMVRAAQAIDARTTVFLKVADRRLVALVDPHAQIKDRETETYGPLPTGSPGDLLDDYKRALDELMEKLDDSFARGGKSAAFDKAAKVVEMNVQGQLDRLAAFRATATDPEVIRLEARAAESARMLLDGVRGATKPDNTDGPAPMPETETPKTHTRPLRPGESWPGGPTRP